MNFVPSDQIVTLTPQLDLRRLEVVPALMLDLIELRFREPDGTVASEYLDLTECSKFEARLAGARDELSLRRQEWPDAALAAPAREEAGAA